MKTVLVPTIYVGCSVDTYMETFRDAFRFSTHDIRGL